MYRYRILLCGLLAVAIVIVSSCAGVAQPTSSATLTSATAPVSTPSIVTPATGGVLATANNYYQAVVARDYPQAYSYMDPGVTSLLQPNQPITREQYIQLAHGADQTSGPVVNYTSIADSSDPTLVVMTLTRKQGLHYHAHLKMQQAGSDWKIIAFDTI